jgi:hypothetical protein
MTPFALSFLWLAALALACAGLVRLAVWLLARRRVRDFRAQLRAQLPADWSGTTCASPQASLQPPTLQQLQALMAKLPTLAPLPSSTFIDGWGESKEQLGAPASVQPVFKFTPFAPPPAPPVTIWRDGLPPDVSIVDEPRPIPLRILPRCPCAKCAAKWRSAFGREDLPITSPIPQCRVVDACVLPCYAVPIRSAAGETGAVYLPAALVRLRVGVLELEG